MVCASAARPGFSRVGVETDVKRLFVARQLPLDVEALAGAEVDVRIWPEPSAPPRERLIAELSESDAAVVLIATRCGWTDLPVLAMLLLVCGLLLMRLLFMTSGRLFIERPCWRPS